MSTEITKGTAPLPPALAALSTIGQNAVATTGEMGTGDAFGAFKKDGVWAFGQEDIIVEEGSHWAINPMSLRHGHIGWLKEGNGRPTEVTAPRTDPLPARPVDETRDWGNCMAWQGRCLDGEDAGQQVLFKGGSLGFLKATTALAQKVAARAQAGETDLVPVVELESSHYTHKSYGRINTPDLKITSWAGLDATEDEVKEDATPEPEAETPEPEKKPEEAAPRRRRRVRK
jgi:hypothetical protein